MFLPLLDNVAVICICHPDITPLDFLGGFCWQAYSRKANIAIHFGMVRMARNRLEYNVCSLAYYVLVLYMGRYFMKNDMGTYIPMDIWLVLRIIMLGCSYFYHLQSNWNTQRYMFWERVWYQYNNYASYACVWELMMSFSAFLFCIIIFT